MKSHPKTKRPIDSKMPIHLVLRSNFSVLKLPKTYDVVQDIIRKKAKKWGVKIYKMANVGNHLHLVLKLSRQFLWNGFIRDLTGSIARALKSLGFAKGKSFWAGRPFTRIVAGWRKAFRSILNYVTLNQWESEGHISRNDIKKFSDLRKIWGQSG